MFHVTRNFALSFATALFTLAASAGGPIQELPEDVCWAKFFVEFEASGPDGISDENTGNWTIRSVGKRLDGDEPCRWIEIEEQIDRGDDGKPFKRWFKYLVKESDLEPGGDPLNGLIEHWQKDSRGAATATRTDKRFTMLPMYCRGIPTATQPIDQSQRVAWQQGEFTVKQAEEQKQTFDAPDGSYRMIMRDVIWKKADVPFGTGAVHATLQLEREGFPTYKWTHRMTLVDHGVGARTNIPDAN